MLLCVGVAGACAFATADLGPLFRHMAAHIVLMSGVAPLVSLAVMPRLPSATKRGGAIWLATLTQLILLWGAHAPVVMAETVRSPATGVVVLAALLASAVWFWATVLGQRGSDQWRSLAALLITGKLFCLLAAILVFSPRLLYAHSNHDAAIADQQLAGLLMIVLCPLTYVVAAIAIAARWMGTLLSQTDGIDEPADG